MTLLGNKGQIFFFTGALHDPLLAASAAGLLITYQLLLPISVSDNSINTVVLLFCIVLLTFGVSSRDLHYYYYPHLQCIFN